MNLVAAVFAVVAVAAVGCGSKESKGPGSDGCAVDTDCAAPRRCMCDPNAIDEGRCVASHGKQGGVCVSPQEFANLEREICAEAALPPDCIRHPVNAGDALAAFGKQQQEIVRKKEDLQRALAAAASDEERATIRAQLEALQPRP